MLLARLLDRSVLPAELQSALLVRAGGNPLYAEEFARMAAERPVADLTAAELPGSVQGIIAARLDGLDPEDKTLLQDAAVVGKTFWAGAVAAIGGRERADLERRLHELERGRFVRRSRRSSVGGETEYAFLHLLVRDVAYGQIPRGARGEKHREAAAWIGSLGGDRLEDRAELLAHHYRSALELTRAAGLDATALEGPARLALRAAGDRAYALGGYAAAERAYAAAVDLWPPDDPERPALLLRYGRTLSLDRDAGSEELTEARDGFLASDQRDAAAEAELLIGDLAWRRGMGEEAQTHIERAMTLADGLPPTPELAAVKSHLSRYFMVAGRHDDAIRIGREALAIAQDLDLADLQAFAMSSLGTALINRGDTDEGFRDLEEGIAIAERANSPWHLTRGQVNLGVSYFLVGHVSAAIPVHERNLEAARRFGIQGAIIWNLAEVAFDYCLAGRWDESLAIHDAEIARIEAGAPHYIETQHRHSRSRIRLGRGDLAGALEDTDRAIEAGREAGDPQALLPCLAERARTLLVAGRGEEAEVVVSEILHRNAAEPSLDWAWWILQASVVLTARGRGDDLLALGGESLPSDWVRAARLWASDDFIGAADLLREMGAAPDEAYARMQHADRLIAEGRRPEAEPALSRALELFRMMGATGWIGEAWGAPAGAARLPSGEGPPVAGAVRLITSTRRSRRVGDEDPTISRGSDVDRAGCRDFRERHQPSRWPGIDPHRVDAGLVVHAEQVEAAELRIERAVISDHAHGRPVPRSEIDQRLGHLRCGLDDAFVLSPSVVSTWRDQIDLVVTFLPILATDQIAGLGLDRDVERHAEAIRPGHGRLRTERPVGTGSPSRVM